MQVHPHVAADAERLSRIFEDWQVLDSDSAVSVTLQHRDKPAACLSVRVDSYGHKAERYDFFARWPSYNGCTYRQEGIYAISVSKSRRDDHIRRDVERRLITPFLLQLDISLREIAKAKAIDAQKLERMSELAELFNTRPPAPPHERIYSDELHMTVRTNYDGSKFSVAVGNLPFEAVKRLIEMARIELTLQG